MINITLLILQIVGLITYPPLLLSIFTGKNLINLIDEQNCKGTTPDAKEACNSFKKYKVNMMIIMILYIISILFYAVSIYFNKHNEKISKILLICGGVMSISGASLLIGTIISMINMSKKYLGGDCNNQTGEGDNCIGSADKYIWLACSLTLIFSLISGIIGVSNVFRLKSS